MIQFFHVDKAYDDEYALQDVSVQIKKGEFVYLTGPSGAGKTTFLKLIFAAEQATRGQLLFNGNNIARLENKAIPFLRRNIGVVFQDFKLLPRSTVEANVSLALEVIGTKKRDTRRKAFAILKRVGLAHKLHQYPFRLSGGEQQRVAIARALVNEPQVLIADEPTGNLDQGRSQEIFQLLEDANAKGTTIVVATHDQTLLKSTAKRIIRLDAGRVVA